VGLGGGGEAGTSKGESSDFRLLIFDCRIVVDCRLWIGDLLVWVIVNKSPINDQQSTTIQRPKIVKSQLTI
jgi:hypothetical protein